MKAYLHFGGSFTQQPDGPFLTIETEIKEDLLSWQKQGLQYTVTGYGSKIPTSYKVKYCNRWYRVYVSVYGNSGTYYIVSNGQPLAKVDIFDFL